MNYLDQFVTPLVNMANDLLAFIPNLIAFLLILLVGRFVVKWIVRLTNRAEKVMSHKALGFDLSGLLKVILSFFVWYFALLQFGIDLFFLIDFVLTSLTNILTVVVAAFGLAFALSEKGKTMAGNTVEWVVNKVKSTQA